jgi:hypothetical protein
MNRIEHNLNNVAVTLFVTKDLGCDIVLHIYQKYAQKISRALVEELNCWFVSVTSWSAFFLKRMQDRHQTAVICEIVYSICFTVSSVLPLLVNYTG